MKKIFLIPLLTLLCTVMAWGVDVNDAASFKAAWEDPSTTSIRLTNPITVSGEMVAAGDFTVDFNGFTITAGNYCLCVGGNYDDKKLYDNVVTFTGEGGITAGICCLDVYSKVVINGGNFKANTQNGIWVNGAAELEMNGGSITTQTSALVLEGGTATITGGSITATKSGTGQAIGVQDNSHLEISGGFINAAHIGIRVSDGSELTFSNGEIHATYVGISAGGDGTTVIIEGGSISDGECEYGVNAGSGSTITVKNGTIVGQRGINIQGGTATIKNGTIVGGQKGIIILGGTLTVDDGSITGNEKNEGSGIDQRGGIATINGGTIYGRKCGIVIINNTSVLNIHGGTIVGDGMAITGNGSAEYRGTIINIDGGSFGSDTTALAIYHPQDGVLNIEGGDFIGRNSAIEMRAGELTIDGGTFTALSETSSVVPNTNGSTTIGSAISIAQHTTKLPIEVVINGGDFRAVYPIAQYNPQKNEAAYVDQVNITVTGGKFWASNTANVAAYTQDNKLSLKGGYYNLAPHAFVYKDNEHQYFALSNDDATTLAEGYLFKVAEETPQVITNVNITEGNWVVEETWEDEGQQNTIPTETSNVTITTGGNVTVEPKAGDDEAVAYANELTLEAGASLTIKDGGTLVLGSDATVENGASLVVEDGGQLLIAPTATPVQPVGSVTLIADAAGLKNEGLDDTNPDNLYWQHFAIPTTVAPSIRVEDKNGQEITDPITYYNQWDIVNGWENVLKADMNEPFNGYNLSNDRVYGSNIRYIFTGPLVGNASNPLVFARRGFSFFGNSYLAPINIQALQAAMDEQGLEYTVYIFTKEGTTQIYRAINAVTASMYGIEEIKPLQGFFMFAEKATEADFQYNSAVYFAFINKQNGGATNNAPARRAAYQYDAKAIIGIESAEGEYDEVVLVASNDFSDEYDLKADARKMENAGMNIYADGAFDDLAVMATNDLMGQTLSFKAGKDALYTMTFSNVEGELALYDNEVNQTISIAEGSTYTFAAQPNSTVNGRFEIVKPAMLPTAIENTEVKANVKGIYTITGQYVGEDFKALPAGVYVINGVKIVK